MHEKELAFEIFRRTRALNEIAREFFQEEIDVNKFDKLFNVGLHDLSNFYRKYFIQKILDSLSKNKK